MADERGPDDRLLRVIVSTEDLERACAFYGDVLGLPVDRRHGDFAWLGLGNGQDLLLHRRPVERSDAAVAIGMRVDDLHGTVERWRSMGGEVIDPPATRPWGEVMAVVRDPDGHVVCMTEAGEQAGSVTEGTDQLVSELVDEVFKAEGALTRAGDALTATESLTAARWLVLGALQGGPVGMAEVGRRRGLRRQSARESVQRLERDGLVSRAPGSDAVRAPLLVLAPAGRLALQRLEPRRAAWAARIGSSVDRRELLAATEVLRKLRRHLEEDRDA